MKKDKELEELIDQVFNQGKSRIINTMDAKTYLQRSSQKKTEETEGIDNSSTQQLLDNLKKQNAELKQMSQENLGFSEADYQKLEQEIMKDFGCRIETKEVEIIQNLETTKQAFTGLQDQLNANILGQQKYIHQLCNAFRRPFVMGKEAGMPFNTMVISGGKGTGKKQSIVQMGYLLHQRGLLNSDLVQWMDLSLYPSKDQEAIFLQDLYMNLKKSGEILVFTQAEKCFALFVRILNDLVTTGKAQLSKRYTANQQGQLIEATSGLVKEAVSALSAEGKFLIFMTEGSSTSLMNVFGTDFISAVRDRMNTEVLSKESVAEILNQKMLAMIDRCQQQLQIQLSVDDSWRAWCLQQYEQIEGAESLEKLVNACYQALAEVRMEQLEAAQLAVTLSYTDQLVACMDQQVISLQGYMEKESAEDLDAIKQQLNEIVGLNEIKSYVLSLEDHFKVQQLRRQQGMKTTELSKHMIFTGNPGTGKTTIARLISRLMKAIGVLSQGQLVEVTRADLVGRYVGHTAPQTMGIIQSALGGVLFIDEAYSLYRGKDDSFGLEAIDTLVKGMEDYREDLIVILAGYSKEMKEFLSANSGLKSRFPNLIEFPDYTAQELVEISLSIAKGKEYRIDESCLFALQTYYERIQKDSSKISGNGRLARNTVEQAILNQASRILKHSDQPIDVLILEDFELNS